MINTQMTHEDRIAINAIEPQGMPFEHPTTVVFNTKTIKRMFATMDDERIARIIADEKLSMSYARQMVAIFKAGFENGAKVNNHIGEK